jgi:redox-sensitive bicupin YhaK (pirin superfamily)
MKTTLLNADTNGHTHLGWLKSFHTFSFGHYNQPGRVHFGAYRVLIKDTVAVVRRLGKPPTTIENLLAIFPFADLEHRDAIGN